MNKKLLIGLFVLGLITVNANVSKAEETNKNVVKNPYEIQKPMAYKYIGEVPPALKHMGPGPQIDKKHQMKLYGPYEHANRQAEFEKKLNLTEEQKKQIEENRQKDHEKIKPIVEQIKQKRQEIRSTIESATLTDEEKSKKTADLLKELDALKLQADNLRKENMKNFENILTEKQKKDFEKIKQERKKTMEKRAKKFEKMKKKHPHPKREIGLPVQPKPQPETK